MLQSVRKAASPYTPLPPYAKHDWLTGKRSSPLLIAKVRDHILSEQFHRGANFTLVHSRQRESHCEVSCIGLHSLDPGDRVVRRTNQGVEERARASRLAQLTNWRNLDEAFVTRDVISFGNPSAITGQQVVEGELSVVPSLFFLGSDKAEAWLCDIEVGGIAADCAQSLAVDFGLLGADAGTMITQA